MRCFARCATGPTGGDGSGYAANVCVLGVELEDDMEVKAEAALSAGEVERGLDVEYDEAERECAGKRENGEYGEPETGVGR